MSRRQRQGHRHLRRMAAIRARRVLPALHLKREPTLMGHTLIAESYGDGYESPREHHEHCSCGALLMEAVQPYGAHVHQSWAAHLRSAKLDRKPIIHRGGTP